MNKERDILKKKLEKQLKGIRQEEEDEFTELHYPRLQQLIGRYFKLKQFYTSHPKKSWFVYTKITDIKKDGIIPYNNGNDVHAYFDGYSFECTCNGNISIDKIKDGHLDNVGDEITEREFNEAWNKIITDKLPAIFVDNKKKK